MKRDSNPSTLKLQRGKGQKRGVDERSDEATNRSFGRCPGQNPPLVLKKSEVTQIFLIAKLKTTRTKVEIKIID